MPLVSRKESAPLPDEPSESVHSRRRSKTEGVKLVSVTLVSATALAAGVLVALLGKMDAASLLLVGGGLGLAAGLHRLGRGGPERD